VSSQAEFHGYDPKEAILEVHPREGETSIRTEDITSIIERQGDSIAVVLLSGVQYYTGQAFDVKTIASVAKRKGCYMGLDLAHAVGNNPLQLHDWDVDFAGKFLTRATRTLFLHSTHWYTTSNKSNHSPCFLASLSSQPGAHINTSTVVQVTLQGSSSTVNTMRTSPSLYSLVGGDIEKKIDLKWDTPSFLLKGLRDSCCRTLQYCAVQR